jgi:hypothetical protein
MDTARLVWQGGMPMMRQLICRGLIMGGLVAGSTGCETLHSVVRHDDKNEISRSDDKDDVTSPKAVNSDASKLNSVSSTDKESQPFFSRTRSSSSFSPLSPEAREIEKDLNIY